MWARGVGQEQVLIEISEDSMLRAEYYLCPATICQVIVVFLSEASKILVLLIST